MSTPIESTIARYQALREGEQFVRETIQRITQRPWHTVPCNGHNPKTGKRVGSRHRWDKGRCVWCLRWWEQVFPNRPAPK